MSRHMKCGSQSPRSTAVANRAKERRAAALLALLLGAGAAAAQVAPAAEQPTLAEMTAMSDLVFRGVAEDVQYVLSEPGGPEATRVPFTFVTYRVKEVLRGQPTGPTVTLQFIGGLDMRDETFMMPTITPSIEAGDEDILFVTGNTEEFSPLVGQMDGRFRVVNRQVYTEMGNAVAVSNGGDIVVGPQYRLKEVETLQIQDGPALQVQLDPAALDLPSNAMPVDRFTLMVRSAAQRARPAAPFVDADPTRPVPAPDMTPAPPPAVHPDQGGPSPDDAAPPAPARR